MERTSETKPVTIVAIGAGNRTNKYLEYAIRNPDRLKLVGVAELNDIRRHAVASKFGLKPEECFADYERFFENPVPADQLEHLKKIFDKPDIEIKAGYLNNLELRCNNELARHKLLDLLGDFALLGKRIKGRVWATRPGHFANTEFMKQLKQTIRRGGEKPRYTYDCRKPPLYDINDIRRMLPHRPPFLLVDRIFHVDDNSIAGIKNVTMNEPFFVGHFPNEPVMPGVLIVEAMAQCGGIMVLRNIPDPENYSTYFMKIDGVKFKRKVVPGDTLQFEIHLLEPIRRGVALVEAKAFVGETLACEAVMMAQVVKNKK